MKQGLSMSTTDNDLSQLLGLAGSRPPLPEDRARRIREAVLPAWRREALSYRRRRLRTLVALALAAGFVAAAGLVLWSRGGPSASPEAAVAMRFTGTAPRIERPGGTEAKLVEGSVVLQGDTVRTADGLAALELGDGSSLRLDAETEVSILEPKVVHLERGALYVDSGAEGRAEAGLAVRTPLGVVHEIGTQFEVRVEGGELRVRVREGEVRFAGRQAVTRAVAEDALEVGGDGTVRRSRVSVYGPEWDWAVSIAPEYELDGRGLGDFLRWAARETGWTVRYSDPSIAVNVETISIRGPKATVSPRTALPLVLAASELTHQLQDGIVTIFDPHNSGDKR